MHTCGKRIVCSIAIPYTCLRAYVYLQSDFLNKNPGSLTSARAGAHLTGLILYTERFVFPSSICCFSLSGTHARWGLSAACCHMLQLYYCCAFESGWCQVARGSAASKANHVPREKVAAFWLLDVQVS